MLGGDLEACLRFVFLHKHKANTWRWMNVSKSLFVASLERSSPEQQNLSNDCLDEISEARGWVWRNGQLLIICQHSEVPSLWEQECWLFTVNIWGWVADQSSDTALCAYRITSYSYCVLRWRSDSTQVRLTVWVLYSNSSNNQKYGIFLHIFFMQI